MVLPLLPWAVLGYLAILPSCFAFLPTSLNFSDPALFSVLCPDEMDGPTTDHKTITREAMRREVRRFFLEENSSLTIPEDASLSQMFRAVYGTSSSPARFIKAVNDIAWSNAMTEAGDTQFQAAYHMDGEHLEEGHKLLQDRYHQLITTTTVDKNYDYSRELLGMSLNSIQDFYSQSTWIELGRTSVLEGLGLPGADIGEVAGPGDATCTNCDTQGVCSGNVIPTGKLSSGYYEYVAEGADGLVVIKPEGAGKCSHGGTLDASVTKEATGGINKETSSPCFSPHHYLHQQAVDLAISASEHYIGVLRDAIGKEHFVSLLNLYQGSALSLVIDTTNSMGKEISTVKEEAIILVNSIHPEVYVLVPYNDPDYGPVTRTSNATEFLEVLNAIEHGGGCCCDEEQFWHGLQLSLINTPDYSTIFCFTDAGANDAELMEGVLALVTAKHCRVNVIYSYDNHDAGDCSAYVTSGTDELKHLATISGGVFLELNEFNANDIDGIMQEGVDEIEASIVKRDNVKDHQDFSFPIDDTIIDLDLVINGAITLASVNDSHGNYHDLTDKDTLAATDGIEIISYSSNFKTIRFTKPVIGDWFFESDGTDKYSISVSAASTLGLLTEFAELHLTPPRPGYGIIHGRPQSKTKYYVEVSLIGYVESSVETVSAMKFLDTAGVVLSTVPYDGVVDDHFYILSEELPDGPFYIEVDGTLETGSPFIRLYPTMAQPVQCFIELVTAESVLSGIPGQTTQATFKVNNSGPEAKFQYTAIDEEGYIQTWTPEQSVIPAMGSADVKVNFRVPVVASPGTTSTITFTAKSLLSESNVNTYIAYYLVLDEHQDSDPPTCEKSDVVDCTGYDSDDTCSLSSWDVTATLQDTDSGLLQVYSQPKGDLSLDGFKSYTTDPVHATFNGSCCQRTMNIVGVDGRGNVGYCRWDLGPLKESSSVLEFVAVDVGETWVYLRWNISEVRDDLNRYSILIDEDYTDSSRCPNLVCYVNVTYLESCTLHTFSLTPYYKSPDGVETQDTPLDTNATTLGPVPLPPTNPVTDNVGETTTTLSWTPPSSVACLHHYQVCFRMFGSSDSLCENSTSNSIVLEGLEPCTLYHIDITSVSISGELSEDSLLFDTNTDEAAPGAPQNLVIDNQTAYMVSLAWDNPLEGASCVSRWMVTNEKNNARRQEIRVLADNHATVYDLLPCTKYIFFVAAVSPKGVQGSTETVMTTMNETEPTAVTTVEVTAVDANSVEVAWVPAIKEECVDHYLVCIIDLKTLTQECHDKTDLQHTFTSLRACVDYDVKVTSVAPSGTQGSFTSNVTRTTDLPTSAPTELQVTDITAHTAVVSFEPPLENPLCVTEYDVEVEKTGSTRSAYSLQMLSVSARLQQMLSGLNACNNYEVRVAAVTSSGHTSEKVISNFMTTEDTPTAPRALTHVTVTVDEVQLHWFAPLTNPMCVATYKVSWSSSSGSDSMDHTVSGHSPEVKVTVSGLVGCSPYTFTVVAITPLGDEGPSATYTVSTAC